MPLLVDFGFQVFLRAVTVHFDVFNLSRASFFVAMILSPALKLIDLAMMIVVYLCLRTAYAHDHSWTVLAWSI